MATQITTIDDTQAPAKTRVTAGGKLAAFVPQTLEEAWRLAGALASSGMTPKSYGADQNKIMVGMMAGAEVGLTPMAALQSIAVIGNNPSLWGDGALGLVQASGLLEDMEETDDGQVATCMLKRKGRATAIVRSFSMEDAKKAGLAGKAGPWTQYPARMRQMRARAFALRDGFADVMRGLHIVEEVRDYAQMGGGEVIESRPLTAAAIMDQSQLPAPEHDEDGVVIEQRQEPGQAQPSRKRAAAAPAEEAETSTLDQAKAEIDAAGDIVPDINSRMSDWRKKLGDDDANALVTYALEKIAAIKGGANG